MHVMPNNNKKNADQYQGKIYKLINWCARQPYNFKKHYVNYLSLIKLKIGTKKNHIRIVVGAGLNYDKGWIPVEISRLNIVRNTDWGKIFTVDSIDAILAEHVWEHLSPDDAYQAARNCFQYLKHGGYIRIAVPDGYHPDSDYIEWVKPGGKGEGSEDHKVLYDHHSLSELFQKSGFRVNLLEYFDEQGKFHSNDWSAENGRIRRSAKYDIRNRNGHLKYTSLILDAYKD